MLKNIIEELSNDLKQAIKGFKAISFCNIESREALFSESLDENFDIELISAYNLDVVRTKLYALEVIGINSALKDVIINLDTEVHIVNVSENKKYFIYLAIDGENIELEAVKKILKSYKDKFDLAMLDEKVSLKIV